MLPRLSAALPALTDVPLIYGFGYRPNRRCLQVFPDGESPHLGRGVHEMAGQHLEILGEKTTALDVLHERYARGEIGRDEYLERRRDLEQ